MIGAAALMLCLLAAPSGQVPTVLPAPATDGREVYQIPVVVRAPDVAVRIEGGVVLTWNRAGRLIGARPFDSAQFSAWSGQHANLAVGQQVVFGDVQTWWAADEPSHTAYIFRAAGPEPRRIVFWCRFAGAAADPPLPALGPRIGAPLFSVVPAPDALRAVALPRSGQWVWSFELWLQEVGGAAVTVRDVHWTARDATGGTLAEGHATGDDLAAGAGSALCGPDGVLRLRGLRVSAEPGTNAQDLVVSARGTDPSGEAVTALGRFDLLPPDARPSATALRFPVRGAWHVALGPGDPPFLGRDAFAWVFDAVDERDRPHRGSGNRLREHHCWDRPVCAPAAGVVLVAEDGADDAQTPNGDATFSGATGENSILIDHGNGEFSHLSGIAKGSCRVLPAERVEAGQELARVGCNGTPLPRPALLYKLMRQPLGTAAGPTLEAAFTDWIFTRPGPKRSMTSGAPDPGDCFEAR